MKKLIIGVLLFIQIGYGASFMTIPYTFVARQLISASKIMANYTALRNAIIDGTKKINVNEVWVNGTRRITSAGAYVGGAIGGTTGTFTAAVSGTSGTFTAAVSGTTGTFTDTLTGVTANFTAGNYTSPVVISNNLTVTGDTTVVDVTATGKITVPSASFTVMTQYTPQTTTPSTAITGDVFFNISGVMQGYDGTTWNACW